MMISVYIQWCHVGDIATKFILRIWTGKYFIISTNESPIFLSQTNVSPMCKCYCLFQHIIRPNECVAQRCYMSNGRNHCYDENNEYLLILCTCCGSNGVHESCLIGTEDFICNDCRPPPPAKKRRRLNETIHMDTIYCEPQLENDEQPSNKRRKTIKSIEKTDTNNNVQMKSSTETSIISVKRAISIKLIRLENIWKDEW